MAQADRYPFLQFGVGQTATIAGAATALVTLAAAPTGIPSTTLRVLNNSTYAPIGSVALMCGTVSACTLANGMLVPSGALPCFFSLGGQTVIQLVGGGSTFTVNIAAGQGGV